MTRPLALALAALPMLGPSASFGQESDPVPLGCEAAGYDVIVYNEGSEAVPAGTTLDWTVRFARKEGTHTLPADLEPNGREFISGALGSNYLEGSTPCTAFLELDYDG